MPLPPRLFAGDEELGKRDDDHKPGSKKVLPAVWQNRRGPARRSFKRFAIGAVVLVFFYFFFKNMPKDLRRPDVRPSYRHDSNDGPPNQEIPKRLPPSTGRTEPLTPPAVDISEPREVKAKGNVAATSPAHDYDGPIKFYDLGWTLRPLIETMGHSPVNKNVLFAAASVKSASILLPIACKMYAADKNNVHFAFCGRDDISMDVLKEVNGIKDDCQLYFHDARPDNSAPSSDLRMETSVFAAFGHIETYMHPQAIIIDNSGAEDSYFLAAARDRSSLLRKTLIELPANPEKSLMWLTRLDSSSLNAWNKVNIDIVIHAQPSASGSLIRLLGSLWRADYTGTTPPRLTIELPHEVDGPTTHFLSEYFKWPPSSGDGRSMPNMLALHHRIPNSALTTEENSIRFLESFWPANPDSHMLILSPQAELSPSFFHYLKFTILENKYSSDARGFQDNFLGISLDLPTTLLNDATSFSPPGIKSAPGSLHSFLWQAPNSNAAVYFGDKWPELHSFVGGLLESVHSLPAPKTLGKKEVSKTYPGWLEHILALARARGYWMHYPILDASESLVTIHNELFQPPEEFLGQFKAEDGKEPDSQDSDKELTASIEEHKSLRHKELPRMSGSLEHLLPPQGKTDGIQKLPLISWDGDLVTRDDFIEHADSFAKLFRQEIGGCDSKATPKARSKNVADDLFCLDPVVKGKSAKISTDETRTTMKVPGQKPTTDDFPTQERVLESMHNEKLRHEKPSKDSTTAKHSSGAPSTEKETSAGKDGIQSGNGERSKSKQSPINSPPQQERPSSASSPGGEPVLADKTMGVPQPTDKEDSQAHTIETIPIKEVREHGLDDNSPGDTKTVKKESPRMRADGTIGSATGPDDSTLLSEKGSSKSQKLEEHDKKPLRKQESHSRETEEPAKTRRSSEKTSVTSGATKSDTSSLVNSGLEEEVNPKHPSYDGTTPDDLKSVDGAPQLRDSRSQGVDKLSTPKETSGHTKQTPRVADSNGTPLDDDKLSTANSKPTSRHRSTPEGRDVEQDAAQTTPVSKIDPVEDNKAPSKPVSPRRDSTSGDIPSPDDEKPGRVTAEGAKSATERSTTTEQKGDKSKSSSKSDSAPPEEGYAASERHTRGDENVKSEA